MKRFIKNVISVFCSLISFSILKLFHWNGFHFSCIERFSPSTDVTITGKKAKLFLGRGITARTGTRIKAYSNGILRIGDRARFNYNCILVCKNLITVHNGVGFGPNVMIFDHDHDFRKKGGLGPGGTKFKDGVIEIGENSWIGANTVILRNVRLGKNCVVAAGSVLSNCEYPDNSIIYQKRITESKHYEIES